MLDPEGVDGSAPGARTDATGAGEPIDPACGRKVPERASRLRHAARSRGPAREAVDADREAADPSVYLVMVEREEDLAPFVARGFEPVTERSPAPGPLWTDDHVNTIAALLPDWE